MLYIFQNQLRGKFWKIVITHFFVIDCDWFSKALQIIALWLNTLNDACNCHFSKGLKKSDTIHNNTRRT